MKRSCIIFLLLFSACGVSPHQKATDILATAMNDESAVIRVNAAKAYARIGDPRGMQVLYAILRGDDANGIAAALAALWDLGDDTYSPVIAELTGHEDPLIRTEAYRLISLMADTQAHGLLIAGTGSRIGKIRRFSYEGLAKFKDERTIARGMSDVDPLARIAAAKALCLIGKKEMENFIRKEMQTRNVEIWRESIAALAEIGDTTMVPFIKDSLIAEPDVPVDIRLAAAEALLMLDEPEGLGAFEQALASGDPFARVQTVRILKDHLSDKTAALLEQAVGDDYINVSVVAVEALADYHAGSYRDIFIAAMNAPNPLLRIAAAGAYLRGE